MIPTRIGSQYNDGTVVGFNSATGSVVVFANTKTRVSEFFLKDFDNVQANTLQDYPNGYRWPAGGDFNCVVDIGEISTAEMRKVSQMFAFYMCRWFSNYDFVFLLTSEYNREGRSGFVDIMFSRIINDNTWTCKKSVLNANSNYGWLIPVFEINGTTIS